MKRMRNTTRDSAKAVFRNLHFTCPRCGKPLKRIVIQFFGKPTEVPCYGSCGCDESRMDVDGVPRAKRNYSRIGIPSRYLDADCDVSEYAEMVANGRSLYVVGKYGNGKTYFAAALAKRLCDAGETVRFENSKHLITEIQGTYDGRRTDALDRAYNCSVLVLDDLGKEQPTEYSISMLYELIDSRYAAGKRMVVTSNFERGELLGRLATRDAATAEAIVSRLCDGVDVVRFDGPDRRLS